MARNLTQAVIEASAVPGVQESDIVAMVDRALDLARHAERERCARVAEQHRDTQPAAVSAKRAIAAAIRADTGVG